MGALAYEGPAVLRWRANRSFAIDCNVAAAVEAAAGGWAVTVVAGSDDDQWGIEAFPSPWELVFSDGSVFDVEVRRASGKDTWLVSEVAAEPA